MKTLIAFLLTGCAAACAAAFDPVSSINYVDGVDQIHLEYDETGEWPIETEIGRTFIRYDMHDLTVRGEWDPSEGGVDSWHITTEEWAVTLELTSSVTLTYPHRPPETFYGFDLTLEKQDGTWSHELENLGLWVMQEGSLGGSFGGTVLSNGSLPVGEFMELEGVPIGWVQTHYRFNTQEPFTWENGGSFDVDMVVAQNQYYQYPLTYLDVPVDDEYWALSMNLALHDGDMFARFGLGQEISRDLVFAHVPEPGVWAMMLLGLIGLVAFGRKGGK